MEFLPDKESIKPWKQTEEPRYFKGENLFTYINGGASVYLEYGFIKVLTTDYFLNSISIRLEIYEMKNDTSAFGIYTSFQDGKGKKILIGNEGRFSDYYIFFWKNKYFIIITGSGQDKNIINGINKIATEVDTKIVQKGNRPELVNFLSKNNIVEKNIKYFRGGAGINRLLQPWSR